MSTFFSFYEPSYQRALVELDAEALRHNFYTLQQRTQARILAVIKANAYGHDARWCYHQLKHQAHAFALAHVGEARALCRDPQVDPARLVILQGPMTFEDMQWCAQHAVVMVIHRHEHIAWMAQLAPHLKASVRVWAKINIGLNRLGFAVHEASDVAQSLQAHDLWSSLECWMGHFSHAGLDLARTDAQAQAFLEAVARFKKPMSLCNSAATLHRPQWHLDWVRPGKLLYGLDPHSYTEPLMRLFKPVMRFRSSILAFQTLQPGDPIGYNGMAQALEKTEVAVVGVGYADGYPPEAMNRAHVAVLGKHYPVVGRVSMDMLMIDVGLEHGLSIGESVELFGQEISVETLAQLQGQPSAEITCKISPRNPRRTLQSEIGVECVLDADAQLAALLPS